MRLNKILCIAICLFIFAGVLTGCSAGTDKQAGDNPSVNGTTVGDKPETTKTADVASPKTEKASITYWQHSSQARDDMMKALAYEFMQENEDINVKMEFIAQDDYNTKLISALATNAAPSVMQVQAGLVSKLVKADAIQPLDESIIPAAEIQEDFTEASVGALKINDKYYGLPTDVQTIVLYWNKDLVSKDGLDAENGPKTWDELLTWAKKLTKVKNGKMLQSGWGMKGYCCYIEALILQNGGKIIDENGKFVFAEDPKSIEAVKFFADAYRNDKIYDVSFVADWAGFRQGKVAMMMGHPAMLGNLKVTAPTINLGIGLIPAKDGRHTSIVSSWAYVMTKNADAAASSKFIKYLASEDVEKRWTKNTGELPARKSLLKDEELLKDSQIAIMLQSIEDSGVCYLHEANLYQIFVKDGFQKLILTDTPLEEGLKDIQDKCNTEVEKSLK